MILAPQDALQASTKGASYLGGSGGMFPQEIFKIEHSETLFPSFLEREYPPPPPGPRISFPGKAGVHSNSL